MELVVAGLLSKFLTDVIKWAGDKGNVAIPNIAKKLVAFILSMVTAEIANLHFPGPLGGQIKTALGDPATCPDRRRRRRALLCAS